MDIQHYLEALSEEDRILCQSVYALEDKCQPIYRTPSIIMEVQEALSFFPGTDLCDTIIDAYMEHLRLHQTFNNKRLYLSSSFMYIVLEDSFYGFGQSCSRMLWQSMPADFIDFNKIYVLLYDDLEKHWFLWVIDNGAAVNYVLDSAGINERRRRIATNTVEKSHHVYRNDRLGQFLFWANNFPIEFLTTPLQSNNNDSGMYLLKYVEAEEKSDWFQISLTANAMGIERMKYLTKLLRSDQNKAVHIKNNDL